MATGARPALGLSIGVTNLAAVAADHSITRKPVLTLYRQRPPEVGVPSENPRLDEPGLVITDFVDRVGDSVGIVAADGSVYRSEALVADALLALAYTATGGRALPGSVTVTYPAHWGPAAVAALDSALRRASEWSHGTSSTAQPLSLLPDAAAALYAIRADPGIPARGIVAVCDFGGSGTGITLVDAADEYRPVAATVRHQAFSGDLIDQSLLSYVMSELPGTGAFDPAGTSAIGSLTKLRIECRKAKERLSSSTVTTLTDALGGDIRLTRNELEDTIRDSLDSVGRALEQTLARSGIRTAELVAIVSVGGGANIPAVTTTLSGRFCVPVVRTPRPQLTAAFGGALLTQDIELRGTKMAAGDKVSLWYCSANRDESKFADPWTFDLARNPNPHLGFGGGGAHFCLGANLARREIRVAFDELRRQMRVGDNASCVVQIPQPPGMAHHIPAEPRSAFQDHVTGSVLIP